MLFYLLIGLVVLADQLSKMWVVRTLELHETREVIRGFFNLTCLTNTGAAFSLLAGPPTLWRHLFFIAVTLVALVVIWIMQRRLAAVSQLYPVSLALIAGGAAGNLIDRLRMGAVVDFLDFYIGRYHWPAFNVADSAITVGVGLFLLVQFTSPSTASDRQERRKRE